MKICVFSMKNKFIDHYSSDLPTDHRSSSNRISVLHSNRARKQLTQNVPRFSNRRIEATDQFSPDISRTDHLPHRKPQIYHADGRQVERLTYCPIGGQQTHVTYPIVELSIPKEASNEDAPLINIPYVDVDLDSNWRYRKGNDSTFSDRQVKYHANISSSASRISSSNGGGGGKTFG
ncbi:unnamed protein product [Litomosoides sigmodontis]|uniref:Uncharacterized protein n=1 Tax=Litomosoides sigmodontis TaxID=42156 RepID=A0A3P7JND2_LITSI|nr:unnamed protein product [Litomosoides sigmodontis]